MAIILHGIINLFLILPSIPPFCSSVLQSWVKSYLSDLMDSLPSQPVVPPPKEFRSGFDLSALRRKLFELKTSSTLQNRRKREGVCVPESAYETTRIINSGNVSDI